jgi:hypothetical protein
LEEDDFGHFPGMRDSLQKAHFVKSCLDDIGQLRAPDGLDAAIQQAKCKKWLGPPRNGG